MTGNPNEDIEPTWEEHCQEAVKKFLMNAVVIDNSPDTNKAAKPAPPQPAQRKDDGLSTSDSATASRETPDKDSSEEDSEQDEDPSKQEAKDEEEYEEVKKDIPKEGEPSGRIGQDIDIRKLSDTFAEKEISCSFVLPDDHDTNRDKKFNRIVKAVIPSDIVIIDWLLENNESSITIEALKEIAKQDSKENGRMRLICVYTGKPQINDILEESKNALKEGGLKVESFDKENGILKGENFRLIVVTKETSEEKLPDILITNFADLAAGILPSFALASVAAIRRNMHHIITKFSDDLDAAYVANRLMIKSPEDTAELIKDLFISECNIALEIEKVVEEHLDLPQIEKWVKFHDQPVNQSCEPKVKGIGTYEVHRTELQKIIREGRAKVKDKNLQNISHCLHKTTDDSIEAQKKFSNFVVMKRELAGNNKIKSDSEWEPVLSTGSILYKQSGNKTEYYYCLTPACDTLRVEEETNFLFLKLEDPSSDPEKKANLVITDQEGELKTRYINPKPSNITPFPFKGNTESKKVKAERISTENGTPQFTFETTSGEKLYWIGEVRDHRANHDMAELNRQWLRLGINDSEYLRLSGIGKAILLNI